MLARLRDLDAAMRAERDDERLAVAVNGIGVR
jgi:hypothetical protein